MKKIITTMVLMGLLAVPAVSLAAEVQDQPGAGINSLSDVMDIIQGIGNWIFTGLMALAAIFLVIAGFYFLTAGGDPEKIKKAREMVINALIGVAVGVGAKGLIAVIEQIMRTGSTT